MILQRINRTDPEKIFIVVMNSYGTASLANGQAVIWDFAGDADGVGVTRPTAIATNLGLAAAGIVAEAIAAGDYGLVQVYGYHSAVRTRVMTSGGNIEAGTPLALNAAGSLYCLENFATATTSATPVRYPMAFALAAQTKWTTAAIAAFIKAL
ncbi:MAG: hypothetical protein JRD68_00040 [Deltaproteobacteria bacterium]|nr:hypothetical protein [Deltaproteobacteria bacterium]